MYWADQLARQVVKQFPKEKVYTVAAGITPSGTVHIGNFREIVTVDIIYRALKSLGKKVRFIYSWDDYDRIRKVPKNVPNPDEFSKYMYVPGIDAPDPWKCHKSYAEHFESEAEENAVLLGIRPKYIYQHKMYRACKYADQIKFVLKRKDKAKTILDKYRTEPLSDSWYPVAVYCDKCNKEQTKILKWDGEYTLAYQCNSCGNKSEVNFKEKGSVKLPWRLDWPMRWKYENVSCEGGGKEHNAPGGSLDTGHDLCRNLFEHEPPVRFMYDYVIVRGAGGKMSSSKGNVIKIPDVLEVYISEVVRYLFAGRKPKTEFSLTFDEEIFKIYEDFYKAERIYFRKEKVNDKDRAHWSRVYKMSCVKSVPRSMPVQPNFTHCVELINIYRDVPAATRSLKAAVKRSDLERYKAVLKCAKNWLAKHAPEQYKFEVQESVSPAVKEQLSKAQVEGVKELASLLSKKKYSEDAMSKVIFEAKDKAGLDVKDFFKAVYLVLLGKERGPRLAPFIIAIGQDRVAKLLRQMD